MQSHLFTAKPEHDPDDIVWFGSSSFSEKDWVGPFYPPGTKPADYLSFYAQHYRTVEIDATYYAVPSARTVQGWADKVPEGFIFSAKFPKQIVHCGEGPKPDGSKILMPDATYAVRDRFLEVMSLLGAKAGPLLIQFPYLAKAAFSSVDEFIERLDRFLEDLPRDFEFAVEIRNKWWLKEPFIELLRRHKVALTLVDQAWMPMADELAEKHDPWTVNWGYIRLLGDRKEIEEVTTSWDKEVINHDDRLERWARFMAQQEGRAERLYIYSNNHYAGHSPTTIAKLRAMYARELGL
ncbi:DUF72 domain-containing protein [bacterium]|nr:DUF72 domain-containing protein [bacterium]